MHQSHRSIQRYEEITGRAVVDAIIRAVALFASRKNIEIGIRSGQLIDREIFFDAPSAADAYRELLKVILDQIGTVIGPRLAASITLDITAGLRPDERQLARTFNLLPEELLYFDKRNETFDV